MVVKCTYHISIPPILSPTARYTLSVAIPLYSIHSVRKVQPVSLKEQNIKLTDGLLFLCRNFHSLKLYIHPQNTYDADGLRELMDKHFLVEKVAREWAWSALYSSFILNF